MKRICIVLIYLVFSSLIYADNFTQSWWFKNPKGWFWYNEDNLTGEISKQIKDNITAAVMHNSKAKRKKSAKEELKKFREYVEEVKARAVLYPTYENVKKWMEVNKAILDRSKNFALVSRAVLYSNPYLDMNRLYPSSKVGVELRRKNEFLKIKATLKKLSDKLGLLVFFSESCPYCMKQLQAIKYFMLDYPFFTVFLFGKEKTACEIFEVKQLLNQNNNIKCKYDSGLGRFLEINYYPTIYLGIPSQKKYFLLGEGLLTEADIIDRLLVIGNYNKIISDEDLPLVYRKIKENILNINRLLLEYKKLQEENKKILYQVKNENVN